MARTDRGFDIARFRDGTESVDDARIRIKGYDAHAASAGAKQQIGLEALLDQPSPRAAGLHRAIRIIAIGKPRRRLDGAFSFFGSDGNPGAVGISPVEFLAMASRIWDVRLDAMNPLDRIQIDGGCARRYCDGDSPIIPPSHSSSARKYASAACEPKAFS